MFISSFYFISSCIMIIRTFMAISRCNWIFLWISMELNLLSFIPIIIIFKGNQETEASIKYFLAQAFGSGLLLLSRVSLWFFSRIGRNFMVVVLLISLILKLGMAPCHSWYPSVIISISWVGCFILSSWQKLGPLVILAFYTNFTSMVCFISAINALIGGIIGINQVNFRRILAYSSITHIGWMVSLSALGFRIITIIYFIIYSILIVPIFLLFHIYSIRSRKNLNNILRLPFMKVIIPLLLISLGGLPPLTGFAPKWIVISTICDINQYLLFFFDFWFYNKFILLFKYLF